MSDGFQARHSCAEKVWTTQEPDAKFASRQLLSWPTRWTDRYASEARRAVQPTDIRGSMALKVPLSMVCVKREPLHIVANMHIARPFHALFGIQGTPRSALGALF